MKVEIQIGGDNASASFSRDVAYIIKGNGGSNGPRQLRHEDGDQRVRWPMSALATRQCGCDCGRPLGPNGPSLYFATEACQERFHTRNVTPADVPPVTVPRPQVQITIPPGLAAAATEFHRALADGYLRLINAIHDELSRLMGNAKERPR